MGRRARHVRGARRGESKKHAPRVQAANAVVKCIRYDHCGAALGEACCEGSEVLLVTPAEEPLVIPTEAIVVMCDRVRRVDVDAIAGPTFINRVAKVTAAQYGKSKCPRTQAQGAWVAESRRRFAPEGNIELPLLVDPIQAVERCLVQID